MKFKLLLTVIAVVAAMLIPSNNAASTSNTTENFLSQYEVDVEEFTEVKYGNFTGYHREHWIGDALVEGDYDSYVFRSDTGELVKRSIHWRDDLPTELPQDIMTKGEVLTVVGNEKARPYLYYLSDDSDVFWIEPVPENPCWVVWETKEAEVPNSSPYSYRFGTVIDAVTNEVLASGTPPITNLELPVHEPGTVVLGNGVISTFTGMTPDGGYEFKATIGAPQYLDDLHTPIDPSWSHDNGTGVWSSNANLFSASVTGSEVVLEHEGLNFSWEPDVFIGAEEQNASVAQLLEVDPMNENYGNNTLSWSYGNITRSVRLIEGMLLEYYLILGLPVDNVTIVPNTKDGGLNLTSRAIAWDNNSTRINITMEGENITLKLEDMINASFPIIIDPPSSFTSSSYDGYLEVYPANNYDVARELEEATGIWDEEQFFTIGQDYAYAGYFIARSFVYFPETRNLPENIEITGATLRLRGKVDNSNQDFGVQIQDGMPKYPYANGLLARDYNMDWYDGDGGWIASYDWNVGGWNEIPFTSEGLGWIKTADVTKFCLRSTRDIYLGYAPTTHEHVTAWSYEKGKGYRPELEVTYVMRDIEAFASSGPFDRDCKKTGAWDIIAAELATIFESMGYPTLLAVMPSSELVEAMVSNDYIALFYEIGHSGSSQSYISGCYLSGYDYTWYYDIENWIDSYSAIPFTLLVSCYPMCETNNNTLAYAFTKGGTEGSVAVGFCALPTPACDMCSEVAWYKKFLEHMADGFTAEQAFDLTCNDEDKYIRGCCNESFKCARIFGDMNVKLVPKIYRTPPTGTSTLIGKVSFAGRGEPPNDRWIETFVVRFFEPSTRNELSWSPLYATTNSSGYFTITGLPAGTYDIGIKNWTCLSELETNVTVGVNETTVVDFGTTREGDANNDDLINMLDGGLLAMAWNTWPGQPDWDPNCDFNRDGIINMLDKGPLATNWGQWGDLLG